MKTMLTAVVVLLSSIVLSGCVSMPKPLSGEFAGIKPADVANNPAVTGRQVRWGGSILKTYSDNGRSCMEILGQALDDKIARPVDPDLSNGRFVACKDNFLDPAFSHRVAKSLSLVALSALRQQRSMTLIINMQC